MARLIRINPDESRDTLHDVRGVGTSARRKHNDPLDAPPREYFAIRLLKPGFDARETEYYVEMDRNEAVAVVNDLNTFLSV